MIYVCYSHWQDSYQKLKDKWGDKITFSEELPTEGDLAKLAGTPPKHTIFVCDDKAYDMQTEDKFFHDLVSRLAHHLKLTNILLVQDAGLNGKSKSTLLRNTHCNILMRSPRERGYVRSLGQLLGEYKYLMSAYNQATSRPYGYLVVDNHPKAESKLKYRTNVLPNDSPCIIYQAAK